MHELIEANKKATSYQQNTTTDTTWYPSVYERGWGSPARSKSAKCQKYKHRTINKVTREAYQR
jgi:hypothetical protein